MIPVAPATSGRLRNVRFVAGASLSAANHRCAAVKLPASCRLECAP